MSSTLATRRRFIRILGGVTLAILGFLGCKRGGHKGGNTPIPIKITELSALKEGPNYFIVERAVLFKKGPEVTALSLVCTHQECLLRPSSDNGGFVCPCHGATFDNTGRVLTGPATVDLNRLPVIIDEVGNVLVQFPG